MATLEVFIFILITSLAQVLCKCPNPKAILPCTGCDGSYIICGGDDNIDLARIFRVLSTQTTDVKEKHYSNFRFNNTKVTAIPDNVFQDITFVNIVIENTNLVTIDSTTMMKTNNVTKQITVRNNPALKPESILNFMKNFISAERVMEQNNPLLTELPDEAFTSAHGSQDHLAHLTLHSPRRIGSFAFRHMSALNVLNLRTNIEHISQNAFSFDKPSPVLLFIDMDASHIKMESFAPGSLSDTRKQTTLGLNANRDITYLSEEVFLQFLKSNTKNKINVYNNPIDCQDCRTAWVKQNALQNQIRYVKCSDGKEFNDPDNFKECKRV